MVLPAAYCFMLAPGYSLLDLAAATDVDNGTAQRSGSVLVVYYLDMVIFLQRNRQVALRCKKVRARKSAEKNIGR